MATLESYILRMPVSYQDRYRPSYWVGWANLLLERLSGHGVLPLQQLARGAEVKRGVWVEYPALCRDAKEIRSALNPKTTYNFVEENGRLRLTDVVFPEANEATRLVLRLLDSSTVGVIVENPPDAPLADGALDGWLFVATEGDAAGHTFIVDKSAVQADGRFAATFTDTPNVNPAAWDWFVPRRIQNSLWDESEPEFSDGYFLAPQAYVMVAFVAKYLPVVSVLDDMGIGEYHNLVEAWFMWKANEQVSALSPECGYWRDRVDVELHQLRGEMFNRVNTVNVGRPLVGFGSR